MRISDVWWTFWTAVIKVDAKVGLEVRRIVVLVLQYEVN